MLLVRKVCERRYDFRRAAHVRSLPREDVPTITTPVYLQHKLKKCKQKLEARDLAVIRAKTKQGNKRYPIITCKRPEFNCYMGHVLAKGEEVKLASGGWLHYKSKGDYFTIHRLTPNPSICALSDEVSEEDETNFEEYNLHPLLLRGLQSMGIKQPTLIQREAIPVIAAKRNVLCSAETGSGKTLAFLLPLLSSLLERRRGCHVQTLSGTPQVVVLAPSRELAMQITDVAQQLSAQSDIQVNLLSNRKEARKLSAEKLEVVVSTPGVLVGVIRKGLLDLSLVRQVVVDEADTLLDDSFRELVTEILHKIQIQDRRLESLQEGAQLLLVGATLPTEISESLSGIVEEEALEIISTPQLHRLLPHVQHKFFRLDSKGKAGALLEAVKKDAQCGRPVMVFSNATPSSKWVAHFLRESNVAVARLHGDLSLKERQEDYSRFMSGEVAVLSCTDLASRGLDTTHVEHVVNFDLPYHMSDYIHRAGRVGRVGSVVEAGRITSFVTSPPQVELVQKIELAARQAKVLPRVDANIARFLEERKDAKEAALPNSPLPEDQEDLEETVSP